MNHNLYVGECDGTDMDTNTETHAYTVYRYYGEKTEDDERIYVPTTHEGYDSEDEAWEAGMNCATSHSENLDKVTVTNLEDDESITWVLTFNEEVNRSQWIIIS